MNTYRLENVFNYARSVARSAPCCTGRRKSRRSNLAVVFIVVVLGLSWDGPRYSMDRSRNLVYNLGSDVLIRTLQMAAEDATPKTHAFRYQRATLGQLRYVPMPLYIPTNGGSSLLLGCILLSRGETRYITHKMMGSVPLFPSSHAFLTHLLNISFKEYVLPPSGITGLNTMSVSPSSRVIRCGFTSCCWFAWRAPFPHGLNIDAH